MYIPLVHVNVILNLLEEMHIPLVHVNVMTYRRDVHPFGSCERHLFTEEMHIPLVHVNVIPELTEEIHIPLVHVNVILHLQKRCTSLGDRYQRRTLFLVDVSINWEMDRPRYMEGNSAELTTPGKC